MPAVFRYMLASRFSRQHRRASWTRSFIDVHAHYLPRFYMDAMKSAGVVDIDGSPVPEWTPARAIDLMDRYGIAAQVLSLSSPGVGFAKGSQASLARRLNTYVAGVTRTYSPRFGAFAVLPLPNIEATLAEIRYALDDLALDGVGLLSNYDGVYLGDRLFEPIFAELNRRAAVVFVHPAQPVHRPSVNVGLPAPVIEYPFEMTRTAVDLVGNGVLSRYSHVRVILAHGGGTVPFVLPRVTKAVGPERAHQFRALYYDLTATTAPAQAAALRHVADPRRFLAGFDFPFMDVSTIRPAIAGLHLSGFSHSEIDGIRAENARALFPKLAARLARAESDDAVRLKAAS